MPWLPPAPTLALWAVTRYLLLESLSNFTARDGIMELTHGWVSAILASHDPYDSDVTAYPPLALLAFVAAGPSGIGVEEYRYTFAFAIVAVDLDGLLLAWSAERHGRRHAAISYVVLVPLVGPVLVLWRYDLAPAVLSLGALVAALRDRRAPAWWLLGVAIGLKPYPALLVPLWLVGEWRALPGDRVRRIGKRMIALLVPTVVAACAMLPLAGLDFWPAYGFQASRALTIDSTPSVAMVELERLGLGSTRVLPDPACLCAVRDGSASSELRLLASILLLAGVAAIVELYRRGRPDAERLVPATVATLILLVLAYPVFSPQYVVWLLPPAVLLAGARRGAAALALLGLAAALTAYSYPLHYDAVLDYDPLGRALMLGRTAAMVGALLLLLLQIMQRHDAVPAGRPRPAPRA
jgi:hypothetical protein